MYCVLCTFSVHCGDTTSARYCRLTNDSSCITRSTNGEVAAGSDKAGRDRLYELLLSVEQGDTFGEVEGMVF